jgi:two-component system NtrC family sensor kinase
MLEEAVREPRVRASLVKVRDAAERCGRIVKSFLAMARQKSSERRPVTVERLLDAAVEMVAYGARSSGIEIERDIGPDLPPVLADEDQLHQVFANLIVNAQQALRDAPPPRRIALSAAMERDGRTVRVEVTDTGPGVPPTIRGRIFDPSFTTKPAGQGTGIGLSICHSIVTAHGGAIEVGERTGGGARFIVRLPVAPQVGEAAGSAPLEPSRPPSATRVLVVDDEPQVREMIGEILRDEGHAVELAADGAEALRRLGEQRFDLVLTDLHMPGVDGRGLYASLRQRDPALAARTILLTGDALGLDPSRFPGLEADAVLEKPALPEAVRHMVRQKLGSRPSSA